MQEIFPHLILLHLLNGLVWGGIISLIALGLSIIYGLLGIINLAHGEFYMLGAVVVFYNIGILNSFWIALFVSTILVAIFGLIIERMILRPIKHDVDAALVTTFALSMLFQHIVLMIFGGAPQKISDPFGISITILGINYPVYRIFILFFVSLLFILIVFAIKNTKIGLWVRAIGYNDFLAKSIGIPVSFVFWVSFGFGCGLAALAGILASPIVAVEFRMGADILALAFMASIIGGFGNLKGTFIASLLIGMFNGLLLVFVEPVYGKILLLLVTCIFLFVRPEGLFVISKSAKKL